MFLPTSRSQLGYLASTVVILLAAYTLRLLDFTYRSLWFDEAVEYLTASSPLSTLPQAIVTLNYQPPLFSLLLHGWVHLGIETAWLRYLNIMISLFTLVGVMLLARVTIGRRGSLLAGIIGIALPTELYYAQDVGEYALMVCCVTWSLAFLSLAYQHNRWGYWLLWAVFSVLAVYVHYGAALLVIPLAFVTLLHHAWLRNGSAVKRQLWMLGVSGLLALPLLIYFLPRQIRRVNDTAFAYPFQLWQTELWRFFTGMADSLNYTLTGWPISPVPAWLGRAVLVLLFVLVMASFRGIRKRPFLWFLAVYAFYFLIYRLGLYPVLGSRYALFLTPLFVLMLTVLLDFWQQKWRPASWLLLFLIISILLYSTPHPTLSQWIRGTPYWSPGEQMEPVFKHWLSEREPEQATFVYYSAVPAFRYYLRVYGLDAQAVNGPYRPTCLREYRQSYCEDYKLFYGKWIRGYPVEEKRAYILAELGDVSDEFWLIFSHVGEVERDELLTLLSVDYEITDNYIDHEASTYLLTRKG